MMKPQKPLLSICIPTYNRSRYLHSNLLSIFQQIDGHTNIEVVVSDNHSTDDTQNVVTAFVEDPRFIYIRQDENLGAVKNILKLVSDYASGEFCWIVGDDDFVLQGAIEKVVKLINANYLDIDYFYCTVNGIMLDEYNTYPQPFSTSLIPQKVDDLQYEYISKFEKLISPDYSLFFLGELMASIFRRDLWLNHSPDVENEYLSTLETTYPHSVILANTFFGKKAIYIKTPLLLALDGEREWIDKLGYILMVQVKNLLDLYKEKGLQSDILKKCYISYLRMTFKYFVGFALRPNSEYRKRVSLSKYLYFVISNPSVVLTLVTGALNNRVKFFLKNNA